MFANAESIKNFKMKPAAAAIVKVAAPWYAPRFLIVKKMRETTPLYQTLPGLKFKAFSFAKSDGDFGGVYLWQDAVKAKAWFNQEWFARIKRERGVTADLRLFDVWMQVDNLPKGKPLEDYKNAVVTLVELTVSAGTDNKQLSDDYLSSAESYRNLPGLLGKYFFTTSEGKFGGIYFWEDEQSAKSWFSDSWKRQIRHVYGQSARIEWFDTPILLRVNTENSILTETENQI